MSGALWNRGAEVELRALTAVVTGALARKASAKPQPTVTTKRPGWAAKLVLAVLKTASEPLTPTEICERIAEGGEEIGQSSVNYVVLYSAAARAGRIHRAKGGRYWQNHYEEQRRAELGRAAAALALENAERARQAAADAASAKRSAHEQGNLGFGYRSN